MRDPLTSRGGSISISAEKLSPTGVSRGITLTRQHFVRVLLVLAVLAPATLAYSILYRQHFSFPYEDDYRAILDFALGYQKLHGLPAKIIYIATKQHNEYKLGFSNMVVATQIEITHHVDFGALIVVGNLVLLGIAYTLWAICRRTETDLNHQLIEFLPASFLFFSLTYWETLDWAMATLQNLPVILFSLVAICVLHPKDQRLTPQSILLACVAAILAAFSSANGFLLAPIGLWTFWRRRSLIAAGSWCVAFLIPLSAYLYHYLRPPVERIPFLTKGVNVLTFLGCALPSHALLTGVGITIVLALAVRFGYQRTNPAIFRSTLWVVLTAVLVGALRPAILASRYSIYSVLALLFSYCICSRYVAARVSSSKQRLFYAMSTLLALSFCLVSDTRAEMQLRQRREKVLAGIRYYRANPESHSPADPNRTYYHSDESDFERTILNKAFEQHLYTVPSPN